VFFRDKLAIYCGNHEKRINTARAQDAEFMLMLKVCGTYNNHHVLEVKCIKYNVDKPFLMGGMLE
jgi:hypothetical protein